MTPLVRAFHKLGAKVARCGCGHRTRSAYLYFNAEWARQTNLSCSDAGITWATAEPPLGHAKCDGCNTDDRLDLGLHDGPFQIDPCMASLVISLNLLGFATDECCCGHAQGADGEAYIHFQTNEESRVTSARHGLRWRAIRPSENLKRWVLMSQKQRDEIRSMDVRRKRGERARARAALDELIEKAARRDEVDVGELVAQVATLAARATSGSCQADLDVTAKRCVIPGRRASELAHITRLLVEDALRHASIESSGEVKVSLRCDRGKVRLSVADNGTGICEDRAIKGHSPLLLIVRAFAEQSVGGTLSVRRRQGTRVTVSFPAPPEALSERRST